MIKYDGCDIVYAIAFDIDTKKAEDIYQSTSYTAIYHNIEVALEKYGFKKKQGSVYFGEPHVKIKDCHEAIKYLAENVKAFKDSVDNLQMLQILEGSDLEYMLGWFDYKG